MLRKLHQEKNGQIFPMNNDLIVVLSFLRELSLLFDQAILKFFATLFYLNDQRVKIALKYLNLWHRSVRAIACSYLEHEENS